MTLLNFFEYLINEQLPPEWLTGMNIKPLPEYQQIIRKSYRYVPLFMVQEDIYSTNLDDLEHKIHSALSGLKLVRDYARCHHEP